MKTLKNIVEGILDNLEASIDSAALLNELSRHEMSPREPGWGNSRTRYEIEGDTLFIRSTSTLPWNCNSNKFWELIKSAGIQHIESNCNLVLLGTEFDIDGFTINTRCDISIHDCDVTIRNCKILCNALRSKDSKLILNKVDIKCEKGEVVEFINSPIDHKNTSIKCKIIHISYNELRGSDWGDYIESLGAVKIRPSGSIKVLKEKVELDENFTPAWKTVDRYIIHGSKPRNYIAFIKGKDRDTFISVADSLMYFKNGWVGAYVKN